MNERIKEIAEKCLEYSDMHRREVFSREKFAELIITECCNEIEGTPFDAGAASAWLKRYFGIEQ